MELKLKTSEIETLYPFYLAITADGKICNFGKSASKCFLNLKIGVHYSELLEVRAPRQFLAHQDFAKIAGKIINIQSLTSKIDFNGEVLWLSQSEVFLFAILPVILDSEALSRFNLSYSDFPAFSPVFDFHILTQAERFARNEQTKTLNTLEEQNSFAKLNLKIANHCSRCNSTTEALDFVIDSIQQFLGWEVSYEKCESALPEELKIGQSEISLPLIIDDHLRYRLYLFSETRVQSRESLKTFLGSLSFTLENFLVRMDQLQSIQEAQAIRINSSKMVTLGEMAAGIAHELNNPLAVIQGVAWLVLSRIKSGEIETTKLDQNMNKIIKMTERSGKIIHGLRVFARDATEDPMEKIEIAKVILETLDLCKSRITHRGIRLDIEATGPYPSWGRSIQISQVLLNLLNNAADAVEGMEDPWIKINVSQEGQLWKISVIDSGSGIPNTVAEKMMSPFFTTKPPGKGTGLGLSISSSILKNHGGEFWYDQTNPNTAFCFTLPVSSEV